MSAQKEKGTASTRLLGMKFMQRAAAANLDSSTPSTPDGRPAKRARMSNGNSLPTTPLLSNDQERLRKAQAEEEAQRSAVMARIAAEAGETHWVLNVKEPQVPDAPLNIIQAGFADLDAIGNDTESEDEKYNENATTRFVEGRMVFGQLKKYQPPPEVVKEDADQGSDSDSSDESGESEHEEDRYRDIRAQYAARKENDPDRRQKENQAKLAAQRRKKDVKLNQTAGQVQPKGQDRDTAMPKSISGSRPLGKSGENYRTGKKPRHVIRR